MEQTANFKLNQWEKTDRIQMEDFNADNEKLEAALSKCGNCRVVTGAYVGTGEHGAGSPNRLPFDTLPVAVLLGGDSGCMLLIRGSRYAPYFSGSSTIAVQAAWTDDGVSWYHQSDASIQMNIQDAPYFYAALFQVDE